MYEVENRDRERFEKGELAGVDASLAAALAQYSNDYVTSSEEDLSDLDTALEAKPLHDVIRAAWSEDVDKTPNLGAPNRTEICTILQSLLRPAGAAPETVTDSSCAPAADDHLADYDDDVRSPIVAAKAESKKFEEIAEPTTEDKLRNGANLSNAILSSLIGLIDYRGKISTALRGATLPIRLDQNIAADSAKLESDKNSLEAASEAAVKAQNTLDLATGKTEWIKQNDSALSSFTCANAAGSPNQEFINACNDAAAAEIHLKTMLIDEKAAEAKVADQMQELESLRDQRAIWVRLAADLRQSLIAVIDAVAVEYIGRRERANLELERAVEVIGEASGAVAR